MLLLLSLRDCHLSLRNVSCSTFSLQVDGDSVSDEEINANGMFDCLLLNLIV